MMRVFDVVGRPATDTTYRSSSRPGQLLPDGGAVGVVAHDAPPGGSVPSAATFAATLAAPPSGGVPG
jgi:hypothetical protein